MSKATAPIAAKRTRGKGVKTKARELSKEIGAATVGLKFAEIEAEYKHWKKLPLEDRLRMWLEDMAKKIDPLETVAILGTTYLIKQGIQWTEIAVANTAFDVLQWIKILDPWNIFLPEIPADAEQNVEQALEKALNTPQAEVLEWLISFVCAYLIVKNFDKLVESTGNILGMAKGLLTGLFAL